MPVGVRAFSTFLCDACGREVITHEGSTVDGYYIEVLRIHNGEQLGTDNVYACSEICVERAIRDSLKREALPESEKLTATQELWLKGQKFTPAAGIPIIDMADETRVIGTAQEIREYQPPKLTHSDPLAPDWEPEFRPRIQQ